MNDLQAQVANVLRCYDEQKEPFREEDVQCSLEGLFQKNRGTEPAPFELLADSIAFAFSEPAGRSENPWGTYYGPLFSNKTAEGVQDYPSLSHVTEAILEHWAARAIQYKHPVLVYRFAGLVWDLATKVKGFRRRHEHARMLVNAAIAIAGTHSSPEEFDVFPKLERAHEVAASLRNLELVEAVRDALERYEAQIAQDELPGTWGRAFDMLVAGETRRFPISDERRDRLLSEMEGRLQRLTTETETDKPYPPTVAVAARRLATYYRRRDLRDEMRRVLVTYANVFLRVAEVASGMLAAGWLQEVCNTFFEFGLPEDAEVVAAHYRSHAERAKGELRSVSHTVSFSKVESEEYLQPWGEGELTELLGRLAFEYLPRRRDAEDEIRELARIAPITHLITSSVLGNDGREVARVGSVEKDFEGHVVRHIAQQIGFLSGFLRMVVERLVTAHALDAAVAAQFLARSPVFDPLQRPILESGLRAYFAQDWVSAIHVLVPQIENTIRRIVRMCGGSAVRQGRNGTLPLKTLDDLLRDELLERAIGTDVSSYFRILLTDQRGWNVRNSVSHGLMNADQFHPSVADRLFHVLVCLGMLEARPKTPDEQGEPSTTSPPPSASAG